MRGLSVKAASLLLVMLVSASASGQGWIGQERVHHPNGDTSDQQPIAAVDGSGDMLVVWTRNPGDTTQYWSLWQGATWARERGVGPNLEGVWGRATPDMALDELGRLWLVWCSCREDNSSDVASCYWNGSQWTPEWPVNQPDSADVDFAPMVACGGGQVWCVWYGGLSPGSPYAVYASRWNDSLGRWDTETQVSPPDNSHHWRCDVAVDSLGTPHVVWCTASRYSVLYSYFDGRQWATPVPVNDTTEFTASPWASPRIVMDRTGMMHLSFTGARAGAMHRDIIYARNEGSGWSPCQMVTRDSLYDEWYSDIAADRSDNVWVVWDRQNEGTDQFRVYAARFDGSSWSAEERLDNDSSYYDHVPAVCLDSLGCPWVFWNGTPYGGANANVYFNRFAETGVADARPAPAARAVRLRCATPQSGSGLTVSLNLAAAAQGKLALYDGAGRCRAVLADGHMPKGTFAIRSRQSLAPGTYFCRLQIGTETETIRVVLLRH